MSKFKFAPEDAYELLHNPVLAVKVILGYDLPPHEIIRTEDSWTAKYIMDDSGRDTGKSFNYVGINVLKCLLIPDRVCGVISHTFGGGKQLFSDYIDDWYNSWPFFRAQCVSKPVHASDMWFIKFKNKSQIRIVPPDILKGGRRMRSQRWNAGIFNEWVFYPDYDPNVSVIDRVIIPIVTRQNKFFADTSDPVYQNQLFFESSPDFEFTPAYKRVRQFDRKIEQGDKNYVHFNFNYNDIPKKWDWIIDREIMDNARELMPEVYFLMEWMGVWGKDTVDSPYSAKKLKDMRSLDVRVELKGDGSDYAMGVDVARSPGGKGDDFAISIIKIGADESKDKFVYCFRRNNVTSDEMAWYMHEVYDKFPTTKILMQDPGGGGIYVYDSLKKDKLEISGQIQDVVPIIATDDDLILKGNRILVFFKRGAPEIDEVYGKMKGDDVLVNMAHKILQGAIEKKKLMAPLEVEEFEPDKEGKLLPVVRSEEKVMVIQHIENALKELLNIEVEQDKDRKPKRTVNNQFIYYVRGRKKKDSAYSFLYANFAANIWRKLQKGEGADGDASLATFIIEEV